MLFDVATALAQHTGRSVGSIQDLWTRLNPAGDSQVDLSWDLQEDGSLILESPTEGTISSSLPTPVSSIPTPITPYGLTPPSPLSDFVWRSPVSSNEQTTPGLCPTPSSPTCESPHIVALRERLRLEIF